MNIYLFWRNQVSNLYWPEIILIPNKYFTVVPISDELLFCCTKCSSSQQQYVQVNSGRTSRSGAASDKPISATWTGKSAADRWKDRAFSARDTAQSASTVPASASTASRNVTVDWELTWECSQLRSCYLTIPSTHSLYLFKCSDEMFNRSRKKYIVSNIIGNQSTFTKWKILRKMGTISVRFLQCVSN